jgi:hypothetical protein
MATRARPKKCRVCGHRDLNLVDGSLRAGISPRSIVRAFGDLKRRDVQGHMQCVKNKEEEVCER